MARSRRPRAAMPLLTAAILLLAGCQGEDKQGGSEAPARTEGPSCAQVFSAQGKEAIKRMVDIPASSSTTFLGHPQEAAERLVAQYDAGTPDKSSAVDFCDVHKEAAGLDSAQVNFSLTQDVPERGKSASVFKEYRMAKAALVGTKVGVLYFECTSKQWAAERAPPHWSVGKSAVGTRRPHRTRRHGRMPFASFTSRVFPSPSYWAASRTPACPRPSPCHRSWRSKGSSACAPPVRVSSFPSGTSPPLGGSSCGPLPSSCRRSGTARRSRGPRRRRSGC